MSRSVGTVDVAETEEWLSRQGLPYFVDETRAKVRRALRPLPLVLAAGVILGLGLLAGFGTASSLGSDEWGLEEALIVVTIASQVALLLGAGYALFALRLGPILRWALRRTLGSLGLLFPLITRALPLLLLFMTFLFINTEVWQVSSKLRGPVLWLSVLMFGVVAVGFLLARLPEELAVFESDPDNASIVAGCAGTPLAAAAQEWARTHNFADQHDHVRGLQKVNLILVLLIAQGVQVLLLAVSIFVFFLIFGVLAIDPSVVTSWVGQGAPHPLIGPRLSRELVLVSTFLASFAGLYFTVYAVTEGAYREQFFSEILADLRRAVSVRTAYRVLKSPEVGAEGHPTAAAD